MPSSLSLFRFRGVNSGNKDTGGGSGMDARTLMLSVTYSISNPDEPLEFDNLDISCVGDIVGTAVSQL